VKNILFSSEFRVLYESELFTTKNIGFNEKRAIQGQKMTFSQYKYLLGTYFFDEFKSARTSNFDHMCNFSSSIEWYSQK
jgi:hypothetical protein